MQALGPGPVVEREAELTTFTRITRRAAAGRGAVLAVTGSAGIGKTCLLEQVAADATAAGWFVLMARAPRIRARRSALAVLLEGVDPRAHPLDGPARALGSLAGPSPAPHRDLVAGLRWLLADLTAQRPVLILVDDLDYADATTIRALHALQDDVRSTRCVLVVSATDDEPGTPARPETRGPLLEFVADARRMTLTPLSRGGAVGLARLWQPGLDDEAVDSVYARTRGNPRALTDLLRFAGPAPASTPPTHGLTDTETELLRLVCLVDDLPEIDEVIAAAGDDPVLSMTTLARLAEAGLVTLDPPYVAPAGPRVRTAVLVETPRAVALALHDRLAQALIGRGASADRVVPHLMQTRPHTDPAARAALAEAGRAALADGDDRLATALLQRALDEGPHGVDDAPLHADIAQALAALGDLDAAVASWTRARELTADPATEIAYAAAAADALADAGRQPDRSVRVAAAFSLAARSREHHVVAALALGVADEVADGRRPVRLLMPATVLLVAASAFETADEVLTRALDHVTRQEERPDQRAEAMVVAACRGLVRVRAGRVAGGLADLDRAATGPEPLAAAHAAARMAIVVEARLARGELAEAVGLADRLSRLPVGRGLAGGLTRHALAEVASAQGHDQRALELYLEAGRVTDADADNPALLPWRVGAAFAEMRTGGVGRAPALARENLELAQQFGAAYAEAQALRTVAAVDVSADRIGLLRAAVERGVRTEAPRLRHLVATDLAAMLALLPTGHEEAVALLRGADAYATEEGLAPLQHRARRLLDRLGAGTASRHEEELATLTTGERRTARLAADGHTNLIIAAQLGVSVKAVEWHLSSCYRKLGIRSRRQLPALFGAA